MANILSNDQELLTTLVQRSLGLLSEVHEIEKRMRQLLAELTIAGLNDPRSQKRPALDDPVNLGPMRWNHRQ